MRVALYLPGYGNRFASFLHCLLWLSLTVYSGCTTLTVNPSVAARVKEMVSGNRVLVRCGPDIESVTWRNGSITVRGSVDEELQALLSDGYRPPPVLYGTAIPLTKDGYYLTAYHCVRRVREGEKIWLLGKNRADLEKPRFSSAEIIRKWPDDDIALLRSDLEAPSCFVFSEGGLLKRGTVVAQCGMKSGYEFGRTRKDVLLDRPHEASVSIRHTAKMIRGDSGGPLLTLEGKLLGISSRYVPDFLEPLGLFSTRAGRPNVDIVQRSIREDRAKRKTEQGTAADADKPRR